MKRIVCFLFCLTLCVLCAAPAAYAETYKPADTDIAITIDDTLWYVFTRDNIENNPELAEIGATPEQLRGVFDDNNAYMDAFVYIDGRDFIELFIIKEKTDSGLVNLSNYSDEDVAEFAKEVSKVKDAEVVDEYSVYSNKYKFALLKYKATASDNITYYLYEYITIVNKDVYSLKFQSPSGFDAGKAGQIKTLVDSVEFADDETLKEDVKRGVSVGKVALWAIVGAIGGGAVGGIIGFAVDRKRKAAKKASEESAAQLNGVPYAGDNCFVKLEDYVESGGLVKPEGYVEPDGFVKPDDHAGE